MTQQTSGAIKDYGTVPHGRRSEPVYFSSGPYNLFGWLHLPAGDAVPSTALVLCKPFGFESVCSHLTVRAVADAAADAGIPALRFDYVGTGNSEDSTPEADQLAAWTQDAIAAVAEVQRITGARRVCLMGFRLGALIAALAAPHCKSVDALIGLVPVINGRRYIRELRNMEMFAKQAARAAGTAPVPAGAPEAGTGAFESSGFLLTAATLAALSAVDLLKLPLSPSLHVLLIDRQDTPAARAWADQLSAAGHHVQYSPLPGFLQMMRAPLLAVVPTAMVAAAQEWLLRLPSPRETDMPAPAQRLSDWTADPNARVLALTREGGGVVLERPVLLRSDPLLFGIVTMPPNGEAQPRGVILLNSGGDHHIGPRRMHVSLARKWAQRGYFVFRIDLSGLGDSEAQPDREYNVVFPDSAIEDMRAAVDFLRNLGVKDITVGGICSGGYHALRAAVAGLAVDRVFLVNPLNFVWEPDMNLQQVQPWEIVQPRTYLSRMLRAESWRKLLTGDVVRWQRLRRRVGLTAQIAFDELRHALARALRLRDIKDLARELTDLGARGVGVLFVFARGDPGIELLELQSGLSAKQLAQRCRLRIIDGADHDFTRSGARAILEQVLFAELYGSADGANDSLSGRETRPAPPAARLGSATS